MVAMQRVELSGALSVRAAGATLAARLVRPRGRARAAVVLHGATGVPAGYYRAFADWLAVERDLAVLTYDYRDFAASARGPVRTARATMIDWGLRDQAAALAALGDLVPGVPRWVIGHSLGGLFLGFHPAMTGVERVVTVGAGLVHLSDHPFGFRLRARAFWHGPVPVLSRWLGHVPGRWLGFGADLPLGVYQDWRRWCLAPGFFLSDVGRRLPAPDTRLVTARMRVVAMADDPWVPPAAVWRLMALHPEAEKRQLVLRPADHGLARIGHLGAFHRSNSVVWPALVD
jgi:predicted alpha/beta hydrolase